MLANVGNGMHIIYIPGRRKHCAVKLSTHLAVSLLQDLTIAPRVISLLAFLLRTVECLSCLGGITMVGREARDRVLEKAVSYGWVVTRSSVLTPTQEALMRVLDELQGDLDNQCTVNVIQALVSAFIVATL